MTDSELTSGDFTQSNDPFSLFDTWMSEANASELNDANAMSLATVDENGMPNVRIVLLKDFTENGFTFYTNFESAKGCELLSSGKAALCFHWKSLKRQIRIRGPVSSVTDAEADAYYQSRPRGSRVGAWASQQSRTLSGRAELEDAVSHYEEKFGDGPIPRPKHWSGFLLNPETIEFWHDRPFRLHDRVTFTKSQNAEGMTAWDKVRLYP